MTLRRRLTLALLVLETFAIALIAQPARPPQTQEVDRPMHTAAPGLTCLERVLSDDLSRTTTAFAWSPDGRTLALARQPFRRMGPFVSGEQRVQLLDVRSGALTDIGSGWRPQWSADGRFLAFEVLISYLPEVPTALVAYDVGSSREIGRIEGASFSAAFAWRGDELLYWRGAELRAWRNGGDTLRGTFPRPASDTLVRTAFSGDGERFSYLVRIEYSDRLSEALIGETATGRHERLLRPWVVEWSPRGHRLFVSYLDRREVIEGSGATATLYRPWTGGRFLWAPDGRSPLLARTYGLKYGDPLQLAAFDGYPSGYAIPSEPGSGAFSSDRAMYAGITFGGRGPSQFAVYRCREGEPGTPRPPDTVTVYYGESSYEPWAAKRDGTAPVGWEERARRDLEAIGLRPLSISRVRTLEEHILCGDPHCPNGFGLRVVIPYDVLDLAYARCFREAHPDTLAMDAAVGGFGCVPLYPRT